MVSDFFLNLITEDEFLKLYPCDIRKDSSCIFKLLQDAYLLRDADNVEFVLSLGFKFLFSKNCVSVLNHLLVENWHFRHEDIALVLLEFKDPSSIDFLYKTALIKYEYLDYNDSSALAFKCIRALKGINTTYSREMLSQLANSTDNAVSETAGKWLRLPMPE